MPTNNSSTGSSSNSNNSQQSAHERQAPRVKERGTIMRFLFGSSRASCTKTINTGGTKRPGNS